MSLNQTQRNNFKIGIDMWTRYSNLKEEEKKENYWKSRDTEEIKWRMQLYWKINECLLWLGTMAKFMINKLWM